MNLKSGNSHQSNSPKARFFLSLHIHKARKISSLLWRVLLPTNPTIHSTLYGQLDQLKKINTFIHLIQHNYVFAFFILSCFCHFKRNYQFDNKRIRLPALRQSASHSICIAYSTSSLCTSHVLFNKFFRFISLSEFENNGSICHVIIFIS